MTFRVLAGLVSASLTLAFGQPPGAPPDPPQPARFGAATAGVLVDVVVRDRRGRPVTDLSAADFEVFEDGVRQQIAAFEPYRADDVAATASAAAAGIGGRESRGARLSDGPPVIALAWDRLNPEARALAHQAAKRLVATRTPGELVGVFLTDMTLQTVQPYTTDGAKLAAAVEDLATRATSALDREPSPLDRMVGRAATAPTASAADGSYGLAGFSQTKIDGTSDRERSESSGIRGGWPGIIAMLQRMERTYQQFLYESQGRASMLGLLALIDSLGQLPGRKTLFYFCEGLTIPDSQQARFRAVIDTANRNNVSVYTFDAAGLRVHSAQQQTAREIRELTFTALGSSATQSEKWNESLEDNERLLKMDPAVSLGILAGQTGGLLVNNTNALDRAIDRINEDRRRHYLLSYVSTNAALDGAYRHIEVRVKRRDVEVRARKGYRALPVSTAAPTFEYEAGALTAMASAEPQMAFPIQVRGLSTPMPGRPGLTSIVVGFHAGVLSSGRDKEGNRYLAAATVVARVVDGSRRELAKVSQQYQFAGDVERQPAAMAHDVLFFRTPELPPGCHTMVAAVHDTMADRATVLRLALDVPNPDGRLVAGDVFVVSRVEAFDGNEPGAAGHPLAWDGMLLYPGFGEPISKAARADVAFALPLVTESPPIATVHLRQAGKTLATLPVPVEPSAAGGRLMVYGRLPLGPIPPGVYQLQVSVAAGASTASRQTALTIVP